MDISDFLRLPKIKIEATASYKRKREEKIYDSKVFSIDSSKIETIGIFKKKTFVITHTGNGKIKYCQLFSVEEKLDKIKKLWEDDNISKDQYGDYTKKILDEMINE